MTGHVHDYRETPAMHEAGERPRCACGARREEPRTFTLPYVPRGSNALHRMHHFAVADHRRRVRDDVALLVPRMPLLRSAKVTYDFRWRTRTKRDASNYVEGMKPALDALVGRWLVDDDRVELVVRGTVGTGEHDRVVVTVEADD